MLKQYILFILIFLAASELGAQQVISDEEMQDLLNGSLMQKDNPTISNFLVIRQIDMANDVTALQKQTGNLQNNILVNQDGGSNIGYIEQTGSGLETYLWQLGSKNEANLWSEGENIKVELKQQGSDNLVNGFVNNYHLESRTALLLQKGRNNRIELALFGDGIPKTGDAQMISISQNGIGHSVIALMENVFVPIKITQTPANRGQGMQLNISNSAFAFPMK